ncbi:response regulator [Eubacteriales bacterium OttesenSCG-928-N13]|nr:response regulator [Eubacteriales bacterium OttesenSCG-928-N13]
MIRVMIVEDEPPIQRAIKAMIERIGDGFEVAGVAGDGEQALRLLAEDNFDVIFTDIRMPVMDGLQLMEVVHARHPNIMQVVISSYGTFEYSSHALRAHALDYLLKPVSEQDLTELLGRIRQQYTQRRRARLTRALSAGINRALTDDENASVEEEGTQEVLMALFSASPAYWNQINLEDMIEDLLGELHSFTWVFKGDSDSNRVVLLDVRSGMLELIEYIYEYMCDQPDAPDIRCACMKQGVMLPDTRATLRLLGDAIARIETGSAFIPLDPPPESGVHPLGEQVRQYLDEHYDQHITNQTLAEQFGYVPSYISLLFRKSLGISPSDYLNNLRLERAKQMMHDEPHMMVKQIAERVGFKNQYHFSKAFKKHTGLWPTDYRGGDDS